MADRGERVSVVSRSGSGPADVTRVAADAQDAEAMARLAEGADVIYNCVNPPYHRWPADWPPIAASVLRRGAQRRGFGPEVNALGRDHRGDGTRLTRSGRTGAQGAQGAKKR
jgi:hypothetical protein